MSGHLVVICDGYKSCYKSILSNLKAKSIDLVIVKNYKFKNTTETIKSLQDLVSSLEKWKFQHTTCTLIDGLRRAISILLNDFGEILILNSCIPIYDTEHEFDGLQVNNDLGEIAKFCKTNGIQVSLISTLKGYNVLENWIDSVNGVTNDYSPAGSGLVVKLTLFLRKMMVEIPPINTSNSMNLKDTNDTNDNANLAFLSSQMQAYKQHVAKNQLLLSSNTTLEDEGGKNNYLWSGVLSWQGLDPNTNLTREISCNVMAVPVHKRDLAE